ncbi:hypothetical protein B0J11DRAFT_289834 [Dendryphion nanum]|uniref:Rrn9 domain-containing protein n=1 Tax=Dendryphion nanum TaxID=256645 RepID=A0A9P9IPW2_9PLEO|nr:hypothetical protein B0J11DRAFT_289834 [Dendryphion nanum]
MSLFGGDTDGSVSAYEPEDSPTPTSPLSPAAQAQQDVGFVPTLYTIPDVDFNDADDDLEVESEEELSPDEDLVRPNRFAGKPSTWKKYTATERQTAASLEQIQSGDLAAHLYNAHALKKRVRIPKRQIKDIRDWQHKDHWMKKGKDLNFVDIAGDEQVELIPSKRWTAWPLPVGRVPAAYEKFGPREPEHDGIIGGFGEVNVGDELREEILASFLVQAKEQWLGRDTDSDSESNVNARQKQKLKARSGSPGSTSGASTDNDTELKSGNELDRSRHTPETMHSRNPSLILTQPTLLADDDKARRNLQPSINSLLSQLNTLAEALRKTRLNHFGRHAYSDSSASEFTEDAGSRTSRSRSLSRSRSISTRKIASGANSRANSSRPQRAPPKPQQRLSKKAKPQKAREGSSDYDVDSDEEEEYMDQSKSVSRRNSIDSLFNNEASVQAGLMDWSEVLGVASMTGWNANAIHRTAQRCAVLFGENMDFRHLDESLAMKPVSAPIQYTPSMIPGPNDMNSQIISAEKRPYFEPGTLRCPHVGCRGHEEDFRIPYRVVEHVQRVHGYDPRTNDSDNEDRKFGGVHIDGFMKPITAKIGWLGSGRAKSVSRPKSVEGKLPQRRKVVKGEKELPSSPPPMSPLD